METSGPLRNFYEISTSLADIELRGLFQSLFDTDDFLLLERRFLLATWSPIQRCEEDEEENQRKLFVDKKCSRWFVQIVYNIRMTVKQIEGYTVNLSQILGRGSFGHVYKGYHDESKEPVAVKILPKDIIDSEEYLKMSLKNEIKIMQTVCSDNIVGFYDVMESCKNYYIVQELCDGDLSQVIRRGEELPEQYCIQILSQICEGFLALVRQGVIHRDLKPANILKKGSRFKIGDFGFSKQFNSKFLSMDPRNEEITMKTSVGTPLYMSIQILKSLNYTSKCDIWALGIIFYELLHGQTPWNGFREFDLVQNIQNHPLKIKRADLSEYSVNFLLRTLQVQEKDRISWNQIFVHPIFKGRFLNRADENKEYENKMKSIMTKLRFHFHLNREGLESYLTKYGYKDTDEQLSFQNYFDFLKVANPKITQNQALYIFKKTDLDGNGTISLDEILTMLKQYGIAVEDPRLSIIDTSEYSQGSISEQKKSEVQNKLVKFFNRLFRLIEKNHLSLKRVFNDFDKSKKGYLIYKEFKEMAQKMVKEISDEDSVLAFKIIDVNNSQTISFSEMLDHFNRINGLGQIQ